MANRTEKLSVNFENQMAVGWKFGVGDWFRMQLDIKRDQRMDVEANIEKKLKFGRPLKESEKVKIFVWTQGAPPKYSFEQGHVFHEVNASPEGFRRSILVLRARPDEGALTLKSVIDETGTEKFITTENSVGNQREGFVDYQILFMHPDARPLIDSGEIKLREESTLSQKDFVKFLRTGL